MSVKITSTKNYALFETCEFNRDIRKIEKMRDSMEKHGYIPAYPMHVFRNGNGKLKIKAGHHRFEVAKELGIAVYYVVCEDSATIFELENAGPGRWSFMDFVQAHARNGSTPHIALLEYSRTTGINPNQSASILAGECGSSNNHCNRVKEGTYCVQDAAFAARVASTVGKLRGLNVEFATGRNFISALTLLLRIDQFDEEVFVQRVEMNPFLLKKQSTVQQYLELIEQIYNFRSHYKVNLAFIARDEASKRASFAKNAKTKP